MKVLVTNDDGIFADGLWTLVKELKNIAQVIVVAPEREQSAIGTAVTLHQPLRIHNVRLLPEVETYSVEGTPSDCVILALGKLITNKVDLIISGINHGANLGDDVFISGTVSAALQGYLRGLHAVAISVEAAASQHLDTAAKLAVLLAKWINANALSSNIFLNVNLPNLPLAKISGAKITSLANKSHTDTVADGNDREGEYYRLVRQKVNKATDEKTDVWAIEQGNISITPLHANLLNRSAPPIPDNLCSDLLHRLWQRQR